MKNIEELSKKIKLTETEKEMFELLSIPWNPCIKTFESALYKYSIY